MKLFAYGRLGARQMYHQTCLPALRAAAACFSLNCGVSGQNQSIDPSRPSVPKLSS